MWKPPSANGASGASFSIFTDSKGTGKNDSPPDIADGTAYVDGFPSGAPEVEVKGDRTQGNSDYIADIFAVEDEIIAKRDELIASLQQRLQEETSNETLFSVRWQVT